MIIQQTAPASSEAARDKPAFLLPLEYGDRLTRPEFERRYAAMPHLKKAELIEGVVYVGSAVRAKQHGKPHGLIMGWIAVYCASTSGVEFADNATVRLDLDNEPQPDALMWIEPELGGQARVDDDGYVAGPPELIVEIAASSASYDRHDKLRAYRRNGVQEYVVWRVLDQAVDWFRLHEGEYVRQEPDAAGVMESRVFPGLRLAVPAVLAGDLATVLTTLQAGFGKADHAEFVERLQATKKRRHDGASPGAAP